MTDEQGCIHLYMALFTSLSRDEVASILGQYRKSGWESFESRAENMELTIESESPILLHGPIANQGAIEKILERLRMAGIRYDGESYDENGEPVCEYVWQPSDGRST